MYRLHVLRPAALAALLLWAGATQAGQAAVPYPNTEGFGVQFSKSEDWFRLCMQVERLAPPRPASAGKRCDATGLYYLKRDQETTSNGEWRQVRECAEASGDDAVLMMLYANGYGVARDADRAIHHACRLDTAKAEMEGRVSWLASNAAAHDSQAFDLCDHVTSRRMGAVCAGIREGRAERVRNARLERFAASLPAAGRKAFLRLRTAADAFAQKSAGEVDMTDSGAAGLVVQGAAHKKNDFLETLLAAAQGKVAQASAAQLEPLDRELNLAYQTRMAMSSVQDGHPERPGDATLRRENLRENLRATERAWLAYRDAWEPFLAVAGLPADAVSIKVLLTRQRIAQLKRIWRP
jgi:uncharacterized protein YecT (DUF1311 family)